MLFFENLSRSWMDCSDTAILIPNQEWMRPLTTRLIRNCHEIWCKSRYAEQIYREHGLAARYIGFSSKDVYLPEVVKDYSSCIHIAGRSELKGTSTLLKVWKRHPEWPKLTVVTRHHYLRQHCAPNIDIVTRFLDPATLRVLMNRSGIHLCPSEAEGFGHYISEALSTKALVITTNAPPMNEFIQEDFGFLAESQDHTPAGYGERFKVATESLEITIARALAVSHPEKVCMGDLARDSFLARKAKFETRLLNVIQNLLHAH